SCTRRGEAGAGRGAGAVTAAVECSNSDFTKAMACENTNPPETNANAPNVSAAAAIRTFGEPDQLRLEPRGSRLSGGTTLFIVTSWLFALRSSRRHLHRARI